MSAELNTEKGQRKDPVCNMLVSSDSKYYYHYADKHYHFCSEHCLHKFKEHPERYLNKETPPPHETGDESSIYTCPMHPEIQQQGPGSCPKCGMALVLLGRVLELRARSQTNAAIQMLL